MVCDSTTNPEYKCFRLLRRLQQRNKFITLDQDLALTITQSFTVLEIASGRNSSQELAKLFAVDQSTMSRNLSVLCKKKYLELKTSSKDARQRIITLTKRSKEFLVDYNKTSNQQIEQYAFLMSKDKIDKFTSQFKDFNDAIKSPNLLGHPGDSDIRREMRRIVFGLGGLEPTFMGSELNISEWQLLSELIYQNKCLSQSELAEIIGASQTSLPAIVKRLNLKGLLKLTSRTGDKRVKDLHATTKATKLIHHIEKVFLSKISPGIKSLGTSRLEDFLNLFELFIGERVQGESILFNDFYCKETNEPLALQKLREILLSKLASDNQLEKTPSKLFDSHSTIYAIYNNTNLIVGGIELIKSGDKTLILNLVLPELEKQSLLLKALIRALDIDSSKLTFLPNTYIKLEHK